MLNCKRHAELREGKYMISDENKDVQVKYKNVSLYGKLSKM